MQFEVIINGMDRLSITSDQKIGEGSQGEVYKVIYKGSEYALKWYTAKEILNNNAFKENLRQNVAKGSPDPCFVWPLYLAEDSKGGYGYLMELIDTKRFIEFVNVYNGQLAITDEKTGDVEVIDVHFKDDKTMLKAALHVVHAFMALHTKGYAYQDLNDNGFYIDVNNGEVKVVDCDNVMVSTDEKGATTVAGTPGFMAPEILVGNAKPRAETDRHSLAVILFMLLVGAKPFDGKQMRGVMIDKNSLVKFYGKDAVFIYDPDNDINRPIPGEHVNAINIWPQLPQEIRDTFTKAFCDGLRCSTKRPTAKKWVRTLNSLRAGSFTCECGDEAIINGLNNNSKTYKCPKCKKTYPLMVVGTSYGSDLYPIKDKTIIYGISIGGSNVDNKIGKIKPDENGQMCMINKSNCTWSVTTTQGKGISIEPGYAFPLVTGTTIRFECNETNSKGKMTNLSDNGMVN